MKKSHLLINEPPLQIQASLAVQIGLDEAIVLQQLHYWINNPKNDGRIHEGEKWVYNTYAQWKEDNFPFWSEDKIQRIFLSLEKQGVVISKQIDAKSRDMTKFYRISWDVLCAMDDAILRPSNTADLHDVKMNQRIPENTSDDSSSKSTAYNRGEQERPDKIVEMVKMMNFKGAKIQARIDATLSYLGESLRRNTETKEWKEFAKYILNENDTKGWEVDVFIKWLTSQKGYDPQYWSVKKMTEFYPQAFISENTNSKEKPL